MNKLERPTTLRSTRYRFAWLLLGAVSLASAAEIRHGKLMQIPRGNFCVTEGTIDELPRQRLSVNAPKMRAYVNAATSQTVEAYFTYLGATENESPLGSGEMRRQFGLKLRAQDACNLVYAMWRIEPESKLVVSVKSNPGQHSSAQCGNRGYRNIKPYHSAPVPALRSGEAHSLRAEMNRAELKVFADRVLVWEGTVGPDALNFDGPVGIRSDNARLQLTLSAGQPAAQRHAHAAGCRAGPDESE
jgi:hypothetical protein